MQAGVVEMILHLWTFAEVTVFTFSFNSKTLWTCFSSQLTSTLNTDYGVKLQNAKVQKLYGFTDLTIKSHIKETAVSKYNAQLSTSKMAKFLNVATGAMSLASAGKNKSKSCVYLNLYYSVKGGHGWCSCKISAFRP